MGRARSLLGGPTDDLDLDLDPWFLEYMHSSLRTRVPV